MFRRRSLRCFVALVAIGSLASCDSSSGSGAEGGGEGGAAPEVLTIAIDQLPESVDQTVFENPQSFFIQEAVNGNLLAYEQVEPGAETLLSAGDVVPGLATLGDRTDNSLVLTLNEAESAAGNPLTARDVEWTFQRLVALEDPIGSFFMALGGIDAEKPVTVIDDQTVQINTVSREPLLEAMLSAYPFSPIDSVVAESHATSDDPWATDWLSKQTARFGQYDLAVATPGQEIRLEANPNYAGEREVGFEQAVYRTVPDPSTALQLLQSGQVHVASTIGYNDAAALEDTPGVSVVSTTAASRGPLKLHLNMQFPAFQDARVREAISLAVDREALAEGVYRGFAIPNASVVSARMPGVEYEETAQAGVDGRDVDEARRLLEEAGYADGLQFELASSPGVLYGADPDSLLSSLQSQLAEAGIEVTVQNVASGFTTQEAEGAFTASVSATGPAFSDPAYAMGFEFTADALNNYYNIDDPQVNELTAQALAAPFGEERDGLASQAVERANSELVAIGLVLSDKLYVLADGVCLPTLAGDANFRPGEFAPC